MWLLIEIATMAMFIVTGFIVSTYTRPDEGQHTEQDSTDPAEQDQPPFRANA